MCSIRFCLLWLLNISLGSSLVLNWNPLRQSLRSGFLAALRADDQGTIQPQNDCEIQIAFFGDLLLEAAVVELPQSTYLMIPFTKTVEKRRVKILADIVTFNMKGDERLLLDSMVDAQEHAEHFLLLKNSDRTVLSEQWFALGLDSSSILIECRDVAIPHANPKEHQQRWGVIYTILEIGVAEAVTKYGFAVCVQVNNVPLIIGHGQYAGNLKTSRRGLFEYIKHPYSFGPFVPLASLYSGNEGNARAFFAEKLENIKNTVRPQVQARVARNRGDPNISLNVVRAWEIPNYTMAILELTIREDIEFLMFGPTILYFCVSYDQKAEKTAPGFHWGPLQKEEETCTLTLLDYLEPTHITAQITEFKKPQTLSGLLVCIVDFVARKCIKIGRGDIEKTPFLNHLIEGARRLVEEYGVTDVDRIGALLLSGAISKGWVSLAEVKQYFGDAIYKLVCLPLPDLRHLTGEFVEEQNQFRSLKPHEPILSEYYNEDITLHKLIENRMEFRNRLRAAAAAEHPKPVPPFKIRLSTTFIVGSENAGLFEVFEEKELQNGSNVQIVLYHFVIENRKSGLVVGELLENQKSPWHFYVQDFLMAGQFSHYVDRRGNELQEPLPAFGELTAILHTIELVARKYSSWFHRELDLDRTPGINEPLAVARILILEGEVQNVGVIQAALLQGFCEKTDIKFDQLRQLAGEDVAQIVGRLSRRTDIKPLDNAGEGGRDKESMECLKVTLIRIATAIHDLRQLTQQSHIAETLQKENFTAHEESWENWKINSTSVRDKETEDLFNAFPKLKTALKSVIDSGLAHFSKPHFLVRN